MPTYEYLCQDCGYKFEEFQKITADPIDTCLRCGGVVKRLIGLGNGFILRGSKLGYEQNVAATRCGRESPCCGSEIPCSVKPCEK